MEKRKVDIYYEALSAKDICSVSCYELGIFGYLYDSSRACSLRLPLSLPLPLLLACFIRSRCACARARVFLGVASVSVSGHKRPVICHLVMGLQWVPRTVGQSEHSHIIHALLITFAQRWLISGTRLGRLLWGYLAYRITFSSACQLAEGAEQMKSN